MQTARDSFVKHPSSTFLLVEELEPSEVAVFPSYTNWLPCTTPNLGGSDNGDGNLRCTCGTYEQLTGRHRGYANTLFCDGHVKFIPRWIMSPDVQNGRGCAYDERDGPATEY